MEFLDSVLPTVPVTSPPLAQRSVSHRRTLVLCSTEVTPAIPLPPPLERPHGPVFSFTAVPDPALGREKLNAPELCVPKVI